jgi:hypothetical protein
VVKPTFALRDASGTRNPDNLPPCVFSIDPDHSTRCPVLGAEFEQACSDEPLMSGFRKLAASGDAPHVT